jgi:hypothetical protein
MGMIWIRKAGNQEGEIRIFFCSPNWTSCNGNDLNKEGRKVGRDYSYFSCLPALTPFYYVQAKSASPLLKLIIIRWAFLILNHGMKSYLWGRQPRRVGVSGVALSLLLNHEMKSFWWGKEEGNIWIFSCVPAFLILNHGMKSDEWGRQPRRVGASGFALSLLLNHGIKSDWWGKEEGNI